MSEPKVLHEWRVDGCSFRVAKYTHSPGTVVEFRIDGDELWRWLVGDHVGDEIARLRAALEAAREAIRWVYEQTPGAPFPSITERAANAVYAPDDILPAVREAVEGER